MRYKVAICVAMTLAVLTAGRLDALDLDLTVAQDVLFEPFTDSTVKYSDSLIRPVSALLGADVGLGGRMRLLLRVGYAGYLGFMANALTVTPQGEQTESHDVRFCAAPLVRFSVQSVPLSVGFGVGMFGRYAHEVRHSGAYGLQAITGDRSIVAIDQAFILQADLGISRKCLLEFEVERPGFSASYERRRRFAHNRLFEDPYTLQSLNDYVRVGWRYRSRTGIGVGLRWKL
jgi:hypothetical protein